MGDTGAFFERWYVREDLDVIIAFRRLTRISTGGGNDVERGVIWKLLFVEDRFEVLVLVFRVEEVVVSEFRVDVVGSYMQNDA